MSEDEALLKAIYAHPDDDTSRLVYADWLDEHDQPERAEFIRLQVELSHLADEDPRERPLRERRWELWYAHHERWAAEIGIIESDQIKVEFRRGFVDELNIYADIPGAVDLVCRVPGVRRVSLWRVALTPDAVSRLAALDLDSLTILAACHKLQAMTLHVPAGDAEDFAALGALTDLRELHITGGAVTDAAIRHFTPLSRLRTLIVRETEVTPGGARWLAAQLPNVTIISDESVAKSHREEITFCRRLAEQEEAVSAQLPTHWQFSRGRTTVEPSRALIEDGWGDERHGYGGGVSPALVRLYSEDGSDSAAVADKIARFKNPNTQQESAIEGQGLVELPGNGVSCVYTFADDRYLVAVVAGQSRCAVLECYAPARRFERFRSLFLFVARSLRVGPAARDGVGEEVTIPVSQL
jgi:uncharacterized protein (TIGR02996 family)